VKPVRQKSLVIKQRKQGSGLNRTQSSQPDEDAHSAPAARQGDAPGAECNKQEKCSKNDIRGAVAKHHQNLICQDQHFRRPYLAITSCAITVYLSVTSITAQMT